MDWCSRLLGLSSDFLLESKVGGGVILVSRRQIDRDTADDRTQPLNQP